MADDFIYDADGELVLTKGYSLVASLEHRWSDQWTSVATATYYRTETAADALTWTTAGAFAALGTTYSPLRGLKLGAELSANWTSWRQVSQA